MLEVVGTEGGSEEKKIRGPQDIQEGVSQGKANSSVAAFYQRQFKFQRTGPLESFSDEPALGYFHPNWNAYTLPKKRLTEAERLQQSQRQQPKLVLPVMLRPYPTLPDLADTLARLVHDVQKHYG